MEMRATGWRSDLTTEEGSMITMKDHVSGKVVLKVSDTDENVHILYLSRKDRFELVEMISSWSYYGT